MNSGPAGRYADFRRGRRHPALHDFASRLPYSLDPFQVRSCEEIEDGRGVLVAAPTGSGKTVVGEFAVHLALETGRKCFYTTPIKALSNQKYHDLVRRHGEEQVGLLTGDRSINGEAPVVVMTTEVLRNMLYAGSRTLTGLAFVVMDEVHYLADRARGAVWEEVIINLPESVAVVSLSATVSNAEEFGEWLGTVRGETTTIVEEHRPVPLFQHVMVGRRMYDLFESADGVGAHDATVNEQLTRIARDDWAAGRLKDRRSPKQRGGGRGGRRQVGNGRRIWIASRTEVLDRLAREGLLPTIVFIFSRAACDDAVAQCRAGNVWLTDPDEREAILDYATDHCRHLPDQDREVLGYHDFLDGLARGVAAHHAGLLPVFKECVEQLFVRGLVKAVFATETLALGINMPARTVVIEKLTKWNGETHADLTPGEYTQLTGRAGRRGLDVEGHAVVLWQPGMNPSQLAGMASTRTYPLVSSFRPSYNMAVNLVHRVGRSRARSLLEMSFAQFQADRSVVALTRQLRKSEAALAGYADAARCDRGDFMQYAALRQEISRRQKQAAKDRSADRRDDVIAALRRLRTGDVIRIPAGRFSGWAVVVDPGAAGEEPRPAVVTEQRQARRLSLMDFPEPVAAVERIRVPRSFSSRNPQQRRDLAAALHTKTLDLGHGLPTGRRRGGGPDPATEEAVAELRARLRAHPCHDCPEREDHARWAERWHRLERDTRTLRRRVDQRATTVARTFDRVCDLLVSLSYLSDEGDWSVTERGRPLMRLYGELDLLASECLWEGVWDELTPAELSSALSALVFESRRADDAPAPPVPGGAVGDAVAQTMRIWSMLRQAEQDRRLDVLRRPDTGFAWAALRWAAGDDLDDVIAGSSIAPGDFVRWMRQLIDLVDQLAAAAGDRPLRRTARQAVDLLRRGVVVG